MQIFFKINNNANQNTRYRSHHRKSAGVLTSSQNTGSSEDPIELENMEGSSSPVRNSDGVLWPTGNEQQSGTTPASADSHTWIRSNELPSTGPAPGDHNSSSVRDCYAVPSSPERRVPDVSYIARTRLWCTNGLMELKKTPRKIVFLKRPVSTHANVEETGTEDLSQPTPSATQTAAPKPAKRRKAQSRSGKAAKTSARRKKPTGVRPDPKRTLRPRTSKRTVVTGSATMDEMNAACSPPETTSPERATEAPLPPVADGPIRDEDAPGEDVHVPTEGSTSHRQNDSTLPLGSSGIGIETTATTAQDTRCLEPTTQFKPPWTNELSMALSCEEPHVTSESRSMPISLAQALGTMISGPAHRELPIPRSSSNYQPLRADPTAFERDVCFTNTPAEQQGFATHSALRADSSGLANEERPSQVRKSMASATMIYSVVLSRSPYFRNVPWTPQGGLRTKTLSELMQEIPLDLGEGAKKLLFTLNGPKFEMHQIVRSGQENEFEHLKTAIAKRLQKSLTLAREGGLQPVFELTIEEMKEDTVTFDIENQDPVEVDF